MSARQLIYTLCFGDKAYAAMTQLCLASLRRYGRFKGDLVVLTDGVYDHAEEGVRIIKVAKRRDFIDIVCVKSSAPAYFDTRGYAQVAYVDSDMLAVADVSPLLCGRGDRIAVMNEYPFTTMLSPSAGSELVDLHDRARASRVWGLNSGFLSMRGEAFSANMRIWCDELVRRKKTISRWSDQAVLNWLAFHGHLRVTQLPAGSIEMPMLYPLYRSQFRLSKRARLLHFITRDKDSALAQMRSVFSQLERKGARQQLEKTIRRVTSHASAMNPRLAY